MVDVSAQSSCTISPQNPTTLTATGGVLVSGTVDVRIRCSCPVFGDQVVRWLDPGRVIIFQQRHDNYVAGSPYVITYSNRDVTLHSMALMMVHTIVVLELMILVLHHLVLLLPLPSLVS